VVTTRELKLKNKEKAKENLWFFLQLLNLYNYNIIFYFSVAVIYFAFP